MVKPESMSGTKLHVVEAAVQSAGRKQRVVRPALHQPAIREHDDQVRVPHGRQAVRDHEHRTMRHEAIDRLLHQALRLGVEGAGRLVEDQDRRVAQQGPRDRDALALPAGEPRAPLAQQRVVSLRKLGDELVRVRGLAGVSPGRSPSSAGTSRTSKQRSAAATAPAMIAGYCTTAFTGDMSRKAKATNAMNSSGRRASFKPHQMISTITTPANISLTGLVSVEAPCARSTRLRYRSASRWNRSTSNASATYARTSLTDATISLTRLVSSPRSSACSRERRRTRATIGRMMSTRTGASTRATIVSRQESPTRIAR